MSSIRTTALDAALTQVLAAARKSHELNYETLYVGTDGEVYWSESINKSDRQYYRDRPGMVYIESLLQVGTGSWSCNCDHCNMVGQPDGYESDEDAIADAVTAGDNTAYEDIITARMDADCLHDRDTSVSGIPYGYFDDEQDDDQDDEV